MANGGLTSFDLFSELGDECSENYISGCSSQLNLDPD